MRRLVTTVVCGAVLYLDGLRRRFPPWCFATRHRVQHLLSCSTRICVLWWQETAPAPLALRPASATRRGPVRSPGAGRGTHVRLT